jgi:hypothetical protein
MQVNGINVPTPGVLYSIVFADRPQVFWVWGILYEGGHASKIILRSKRAHYLDPLYLTYEQWAELRPSIRATRESQE